MGSKEIADIRKSAAETLKQSRMVHKAGGKVVDKGIGRAGSAVSSIRGSNFRDEVVTRAVERTEKVDEITSKLSKGHKFSNPRVKMPSGLFSTMEFINTQAAAAAANRTPGITPKVKVKGRGRKS
jgi:hypothetical protein